jgi:thiamine kinase-like enzyme
MTSSVEEVIARVPLWCGAKNLKVTRLGGGITNQNYRVDMQDGSFVLRISGANTGLLGIDREVEYAASCAAAAIGVAPEVVYVIRPEGYLVTRFVEGRPVSVQEIGRPENIRRVVEALRKVHGLSSIPGKFSPFQVVENYTEIARRYKVAFPESFDWLLEQMGEVEQAFLRHPFTPRPCHNDLLNGNFLDDGQLRILDWEYAGMGDVFFDLANFAVNHMFSPDQDRLLLECYFGEATTAQRARLRLMKIMSDFREAMWGMVQIGISQLDFDFREYADKHFKRMTERIKDPSWRTWLQEASDGI